MTISVRSVCILCMYLSFRGVFCLCRTVYRVALIFRMESNGPNYSDNPGLLSRGRRCRSGGKVICYLHLAMVVPIRQTSSCQFIFIYLEAMSGV